MELGQFVRTKSTSVFAVLYQQNVGKRDAGEVHNVRSLSLDSASNPVTTSNNSSVIAVCRWP